jgi:predicted RNase H-like nuclease
MSGAEAVGSIPVFLGVDLAGRPVPQTGGDDTGRLMASARVKTHDEIARWIAAQPGRVIVTAVDAPLIVPNETGQRVPGKLIGQAFGGFGASAHTSDHTRFPGGDTQALRLAQPFGWAVDPGTPTGGDVGVCIEVYPHPRSLASSSS